MSFLCLSLLLFIELSQGASSNRELSRGACSRFRVQLWLSPIVNDIQFSHGTSSNFNSKFSSCMELSHILTPHGAPASLFVYCSLFLSLFAAIIPFFSYCSNLDLLLQFISTNSLWPAGSGFLAPPLPPRKTRKQTAEIEFSDGNRQAVIKSFHLLLSG